MACNGVSSPPFYRKTLPSVKAAGNNEEDNTMRSINCSDTPSPSVNGVQTPSVYCKTKSSINSSISDNERSACLPAHTRSLPNSSINTKRSCSNENLNITAEKSNDNKNSNRSCLIEALTKNTQKSNTTTTATNNNNDKNNKRSRLIPTLAPTTNKDGVSRLFQEPHVDTGYRQKDQPWSYYLCSLFQVHNECLNCWTHLVGLAVMAYQTWQFSREFDLVRDPYMWPLGAGLLTSILLLMCSVAAHCFHNKSELVHYTCFLVDYAGIGLHGVSSSIVHYWYCLHDDIFGTFPHRFAAAAGVVIGSITVFCNSHAKTHYSRPYPFARRLWQVGSVLQMYCWNMFPIWYQLYLFIFHNYWEPSLQDHLWQMFWMLCSAFFFGSEVPQRYLPGRCDFLGHSHQIFHVCVFLVAIKQLDAVYLEITTDSKLLYADAAPTFRNTFGAVFLGIFINICLVVLFREVAKRKIAREASLEEKRH